MLARTLLFAAFSLALVCGASGAARDVPPRSLRELTAYRAGLARAPVRARPPKTTPSVAPDAASAFATKLRWRGRHRASLGPLGLQPVLRFIYPVSGVLRGSVNAPPSVLHVTVIFLNVNDFDLETLLHLSMSATSGASFSLGDPSVLARPNVTVAAGGATDVRALHLVAPPDVLWDVLQGPTIVHARAPTSTDSMTITVRDPREPDARETSLQVALAIVDDGESTAAVPDDPVCDDTCEAALVTLAGGTRDQAIAAASMAFQSMLGLICDPIANRVEAPCLGKNVMAASNALSCANMALAGYDPLIPLDEVIDAAKAVAHAMPREHRCTSLGGLAVTPTSLEIEERLRVGKASRCGGCAC